MTQEKMANELILDSTGNDTEEACQSIYLFYNVFIRKVNVLKKRRLYFSWETVIVPCVGRSSEKGADEQTSSKVESADGDEQMVQESILKPSVNNDK